MWVAWMAAAALASGGCGPDLITQLPVACVRVAPAPDRAVYPVAPDAAVDVYGRWRRWRPLHLIGSTDCVDTLRRRDLTAWVYRCGTQIEVTVGRRDRNAPRIVRIDVAGGRA